MDYSFKVGAFTVAAAATLFLANCSPPDPAIKRLNREAQSSGIETELRQLHARQKLGPITVTGVKFEELYDPWFQAVYEIAPEVDAWKKMAPHGVIRGKIADRDTPATIRLTGRSPVESLDLICASFDAYFTYTEYSTVVVAATRNELKPRLAATGHSTEDDPFSPANVSEAEHAGAGQPATASESKSEGGDKRQPESEGNSR